MSDDSTLTGEESADSTKRGRASDDYEDRIAALEAAVATLQRDLAALTIQHRRLHLD